MALPTKAYSTKQEHNTANALGWEVVSGSGARPCVPGDIISDDWLGECKTHADSHKSIYFGLDVWNKICEESVMKHRHPALFTDDGSQDLKRTWVICNKHAINMLEDVIPVRYPSQIKKNISFDHYEKSLYLKEACDSLEYPVFEIDWNGNRILLMQFNTFKEIYNR